MDIDVFYLTAGDRNLASTRYRAIYLFPYLKEYGIYPSIREIQPIQRNGFRTLGNNLSFVGHAGYALLNDIVTVQKSVLNNSKINILRKCNKRIVYDFDDAIYTQPPWKTDQDTTRKKKLDQMLKSVSYVIAGNPVLADYASRFCRTVYQAPTAIPKASYVQYREHGSPQNDKTTIGWIGNEENLWYLRQIEGTLSNLLTHNDSVELNIITADQRPLTPLSDRVGDDVSYVPWSEERELDYLNKIDIGIRPLTHDEWSRAKGGFTSVIQCMGLGKPVVVTPVGMLKDIVEHGSCGFHADSPDEWIEYLEYLIENPSRRQEMGNRAFERVGEKRFWTEQRAADLASFYKSICD